MILIDFFFSPLEPPPPEAPPPTTTLSSEMRSEAFSEIVINSRGLKMEWRRGEGSGGEGLQSSF